MKLHEIIGNTTASKEVMLDHMQPYIRSLYIFYRHSFCCEPVLMVTSVTNSASLGMIVPSEEFQDAVFHYVEENHPEATPGEKKEYMETINFNSLILKVLLQE